MRVHLPRIALLLVLVISVSSLIAADAAPAKPDDASHKLLTYKTTPQAELKIEIFLPPDWKASDHRAAIVFFFGGGWSSGDRRQFVPQCQYLAKRGMVAATADYRVRTRNQTTPDKCLEDAKSAVRWLRQHAEELGIDVNRVAAGGGSAGGHLAAATALVPFFDPPGEDAKISSIPNALVLFNPALDVPVQMAAPINPKEDPAKVAHDFSPNSFISAKTPPAVIFFGTNDGLGETGQTMLAKSAAAGNRCELYLAEGMKHGFFNRAPWLESTLRQADIFLESLGYLQGKPTIEENSKALLKRAETAHIN